MRPLPSVQPGHADHPEDFVFFKWFPDQVIPAGIQNFHPQTFIRVMGGHNQGRRGWPFERVSQQIFPRAPGKPGIADYYDARKFP